jgi:hypothetical protein
LAYTEIGNDCTAINLISKASELAHEAVSDRGRVVGHGGSPFFGVAHVRGGEACGHMCVDFVSDRLATCLRAKKGAGPINHKYAYMPDGKLTSDTNIILCL